MSGTAELKNVVKVSEAGPSRKRISIEIPKETVTATLGTSLDMLVDQAEISGFRKGRAPKRLVEKRFGAAIMDQARQSLVSTAYQAAIEEHKIRPIGNPTAKDLEKAELAAGKVFAFELEVEVLPEFDLPSLDGVAIRKPKMEVADKMVNDELDRLRIQEGSLEERQASEPGDYLTGHAKMEDKGGKVHFESDGIVVQVPPKDKAPKGMIVGLMVDDLSTQIGLPKPGATVKVKTKGPDNHENEALRGVDLTVTYTPARCDRIIPASNADLVARFGLADEKALTDGLRERLEGRVKMDQQAAMRSQIAKYLLEQTKMDLPQRLTAEQAGRNLERRRLELMYRGADAVQIEQNIAELRAASAFDAVRDLKLFFILDKAAEKMNVQVTEQEVNGRIAQMAFERGMRPDQLRQQMIQNGQATGIFNQIREHKVMDAIIGKAKVDEMSLEDYNKAISAENEEAAKKSGKKS